MDLREKMSNTDLKEIPKPGTQLLDSAVGFSLNMVQDKDPEEIINTVKAKFFDPTFYCITDTLLIIGVEHEPRTTNPSSIS